MDGIDPERLRLPNAAVVQPHPKRDLPRHRQGGKFLKGPIPLNWLAIAASQAGKALHVALFLWFKAGMLKGGVVPLSVSALAQFGVKRETARRGLASLETAGLVAVKRHPGRMPIVTLLDAPEEDTESEAA